MSTEIEDYSDRCDQLLAPPAKPSDGSPPLIAHHKHHQPGMGPDDDGNKIRTGYRVAARKNVPQVALEAGNLPRMIQKHCLELVTDLDAARWFGLLP